VDKESAISSAQNKRARGNRRRTDIYRERNRATLAVKNKHVCDDNSDEQRLLVFFFFFCEEKNNFFIIIEESNPSSRFRDGIEQRVSIRRVLAWNRDADAGRVGV
jgi:hypothetical protein